MRIWLYYRLSRDEDEELNSLTNQRKIIYDYAVSQGHEIVGESFDDNVSGMHFNREGIDKIYEAVEAGLIDAVIVKEDCAIIELYQKGLGNQGFLAWSYLFGLMNPCREDVQSKGNPNEEVKPNILPLEGVLQNEKFCSTPSFYICKKERKGQNLRKLDMRLSRSGVSTKY